MQQEGHSWPNQKTLLTPPRGKILTKPTSCSWLQQKKSFLIFFFLDTKKLSSCSRWKLGVHYLPNKRVFFWSIREEEKNSLTSKLNVGKNLYNFFLLPSSIFTYIYYVLCKGTSLASTPDVNPIHISVVFRAKPCFSALGASSAKNLQRDAETNVQVVVHGHRRGQHRWEIIEQDTNRCIFLQQTEEFRVIFWLGKNMPKGRQN